jgi:hypothetical protein
MRERDEFPYHDQQSNPNPVQNLVFGQMQSIRVYPAHHILHLLHKGILDR